MKDNKADILVITPHPDDAEFGVSGTVAKLTRQGKSVAYVVVTNGDKGTDDINVLPEELAKIREKEQLDAAKVLGVTDVIFLRHSDQTLEDTPEFRKEIVRYIRIYRPEVVVTADPYRRYMWHRDHRIVGRVVLDAVFPYARDVWAYLDLVKEGIHPHKVKEVWLWAPEDRDINFRSDITETFDLKVKALSCHKSQIKEPFKSEMEKWLCRRAKDMAEGEKFKLAEGFHRVEIWW
ncbi:MAG: PIG-L family deacetylase [Candidatus Aminicenantes bacterium]|jgi:LmbE family N-acetylglucosaminyl deacetylase|nr:PIG-L family deacetylase [Candidatus Aminicenantes bacterium]MDH5384273.1 PIG-L family deacetylase [Candidatus Aminicenantes bacterium]MDH5744411.1 PIG-L family deacetylase [Candidatus Aminicenantes bacterium]